MGSFVANILPAALVGTFLWVMFALLDPDALALIESGSNTDPDPKPWFLCLFNCRFLAMGSFVANILPAALVGTSLGQQVGRTVAALQR